MRRTHAHTLLPPRFLSPSYAPVMLAECLLKHCDNLSKTMQSTAIPAVEARRLSKLCVAVLQKMRGDAEFDLFWSLVIQTQKQVHVEDPALQRRRKRPKRYDDGCEGHSFSHPQLYYKTVYFQCLDTAISTIRYRFHQQDYFIYVSLDKFCLRHLLTRTT